MASRARNFKQLTVSTGVKEPEPSREDAQLPGSQAALYYNDDLATLQMGIEFKVDLRAEDLCDQQELGHGNSGTVTKVEHLPTKTVMAKKVIHIEASPAVRKQILRELQILRDCSSPYIVSFYGAFLDHADINLCMEYMDCGSLDKIYKTYGPIDVPVLGKIAFSVINGLSYLYGMHRIIHRDVKPSNILINSSGQIKLCDFGVSGELENSIANTFVGTSTYMSPERIQGGPYTVKSDIWSLGITLIELALGRYAYSSRQNSGAPIGILDLLQQIVNEDPPQLPNSFPPELRNLIHVCTLKDFDSRPNLNDLAQMDFIVWSEKSNIHMAHWVQSLQAAEV